MGLLDIAKLIINSYYFEFRLQCSSRDRRHLAQKQTLAIAKTSPKKLMPAIAKFFVSRILIDIIQIEILQIGLLQTGENS